MLLIAQAAGGKDDKKLGEIGLSDLAFSAKPRIEGLYGGAFCHCFGENETTGDQSVNPRSAFVQGTKSLPCKPLIRRRTLQSGSSEE